MALRINDTVPNLDLKTDLGDFKLHDFIGDSWAILFSHPKDLARSAPPSSVLWLSWPPSGKSAVPR